MICSLFVRFYFVFALPGASVASARVLAFTCQSECATQTICDFVVGNIHIGSSKLLFYTYKKKNEQIKFI